MKIQVQQNIEYPLKDIDNHGNNCLETTYAVSIFFYAKNLIYIFLMTRKRIAEAKFNIIRRIYSLAYGSSSMITLLSYI